MRESKNSFRLWRPPLFSRVGSRPSRDCNPARLGVRSRLQVRGREPRGAERRGEGRGAATRHTHSPRFPIQDWGLCVDNSIPVGLGVRPGPRLGGLAVSLAPALATHTPTPTPRPRWLGPLWVISVYRESGSKLGSISALVGCSAEPCRPGRRRENPAEPTFALSLPPPPGEVG